MKCPICGLQWSEDCPHTTDDIIKEFGLELNRHLIQTSKDKKEIQILKETNESFQTILDNQPSKCEHLDECTEYAIENHEPDRDPNG